MRAVIMTWAAANTDVGYKQGMHEPEWTLPTNTRTKKKENYRLLVYPRRGRRHFWDHHPGKC